MPAVGIPDSHSATLRRYHQLLWSKPLPSGAMFTLDAKLHHKSDLGEFWLSSDAIVHTYLRWTRPARLAGVISQIPPEETAAFYDLACTVGAYIVFPVQVQVDGRWHGSINQRRGIHHRIRDRFDLTLECIRRHYGGEVSPLAEVLATYRDFFALFEDFSGYVDYFLLNDLVVEHSAAVRFLAAFDDSLPVIRCQRTAWPNTASTCCGPCTSSGHATNASRATPPSSAEPHWRNHHRRLASGLPGGAGQRALLRPEPAGQNQRGPRWLRRGRSRSRRTCPVRWTREAMPGSDLRTSRTAMPATRSQCGQVPAGR
jgi:hypothetical protein